TPATPAVSFFYALEEQLSAMERETYPKRFARHAEMAAWFDRWASSKGFPSFVQEKFRSTTTANRTATASGSFEVTHFVAQMLARGHEISNGYGRLRGHAFRIGHFGDHTMPELKTMLGIADEVLKTMGR